VALELTPKRVKLAIALGSMTLSAFFVAQGSTQLVASSLLDAPVDEAPAAARRSTRVTATVAPPRNVEQMGRAILTRNVFDPDNRPMEWNEPPPPAPLTGDEGAVVVDPTDPNNAPPCDGSIRLVASYYRPDSPEQSFAAISTGSGATLLYSQGRQVEQREVVAIARQRVLLRPSGGTLCAISMFAPPAGGATAAPPPTVAAAEVTPPPAEGGGPDAAELDANITQVSENNYTVTRALVDRLLTNQAELLRMARVIPHEVDGHVQGVKIYGIRRSSVLGRLGVQNGDLLRTINGFNLSEPDSALEAYARLRNADHLSLAVERRGQPVNLDFQIR
jgi:general secretion pathway protein C